MKSLKPNHFSFPLRYASALFFRVLLIEERFAVVSRDQRVEGDSGESPPSDDGNRAARTTARTLI
ncbi:hypothetical protein HanRHA438_Chr02g0064681 [Helianthus annuus]|nr:hypothetical protein HanRHA438_Chr02g0064681 [Helianthus annuus]